LQAGFGELLHRTLRLAARRAQLADALGGDDVFALGRHQFRTVYLEQRLAAADRLAAGIHV
jgi:hypothetical protein